MDGSSAAATPAAAGAAAAATAATGAGGAKLEYVDSEDKLPAHLICGVCHDVCSKHSACPGCQQTFCEVCMHKWFGVQRSTGAACSCPYCRRKLRISDLQHNPAIQDELADLRVHCPNAGCGAVLRRGDVPRHLQRTCLVQGVTCRFCSKAGLRGQIQQHEADACSQRPVPCIHAAAGCAATVPLQAMLLHVDHNCEFAAKPCPHCAQDVPRWAWAQHLQQACPARQPCCYRLYGCSFVAGSAEEALEHQGGCPHATHKMLQQLMGDGSMADASSELPQAGLPAAGAAAADADAGELPANAIPAADAAFAAQSSRACRLRARQRLLEALPDAALPQHVQPPREPAPPAPLLLVRRPPRRQQQQEEDVAPSGPLAWLTDRLAAATATPDDLSAITPPRIIPARASQGAGSGLSDSGLSPAELLALGAPGCFELVGLQSNRELERAWRMMLNLGLEELMDRDESCRVPWYGPFLLYASILRAWDTAQASQLEVEALVASGAARGANDGFGGFTAGMFDREVMQAVHSRRSYARRQQQQQQQQQQQDAPDEGYPGLERGLYHNEAVALRWFRKDERARHLVSAMAGLVYLVAYHLKAGGPDLLPQQGPEVTRMQELATDEACFLLTTLAGGRRGSKRQREHYSGHSRRRWAAGNDGSGDGAHAAAASGGGDDLLPPEQRMERRIQLATLAATAGNAVAAAAAAAAGDGAGSVSLQLDMWSSAVMAVVSAAALRQRAALLEGVEPGSEVESTLLNSVPAAACRAVQEAIEFGALAWLQGTPPPPLPSAAVYAEELVQRLGRAAQYGSGLLDPRVAVALEDKRALIVSAVAAGLAAYQSIQAAGRQQQPAAASARRQQHQEPPGKMSPLGLVLADGYTATLRHAQGLAAGKVPDAPSIPAEVVLTKCIGEAAELSSALQLLHDLRCAPCEVSVIPQATLELRHGWRGFWALSVLAGVEAWLGPAFRLSWQALALVNDLMARLTELLIDACYNGMYDPVAARVPLSPELVAAAMSLLLPAPLRAALAPAQQQLSDAYRDAICEDMSDTTWTTLGLRLGLVVELDKMVDVVHELLPVDVVEDEDEDETESSDGYSSDAYSDSSGSDESSGGFDDDDDDSRGSSDGEGSDDSSGSSMSTGGDGSSWESASDAGDDAAARTAAGAAAAGGSDAARRGGSSGLDPPPTLAEARQRIEALLAMRPNWGNWEAREVAAAMLYANLEAMPPGADKDAALAAFWDAQLGQPARERAKAVASFSRGMNAGGDGGSGSSGGGRGAGRGSTGRQRSRAGGRAGRGGGATSSGGGGAGSSSTGAAAAATACQDWREQWATAVTGLASVGAEEAAGRAAALSTTLGSSAAGLQSAEHELLLGATAALQQAPDLLLQPAGPIVSNKHSRHRHPPQQLLYAPQPSAAAAGGRQPGRSSSSEGGGAHAGDGGAPSGGSGSGHHSGGGGGGAGPTAAAADSAVAGAAHNTPAPPQQQPQQQEEDKSELCTHGVVLLAGILQGLLQRLLRGMASAAAPDVPQLPPLEPQAAAAAAAAAAAGGGGAGTHPPPGDGSSDVADSDGPGEMSRMMPAHLRRLLGGPPTHETWPKPQEQMCLTARHVLLALLGDRDLHALVTRDVGCPHVVGLAWAGASPSFNPALLPSPEAEPLTAYLLQLAAGGWPQPQPQAEQRQQEQWPPPGQQQAHEEAHEEAPAAAAMQDGGPSSRRSKNKVRQKRRAAARKQQQLQQQLEQDEAADAAEPDEEPADAARRVLFPADLRAYCGRLFPVHRPAAASTAAAKAAQRPDEPPPSLRCCFLFGWQCSGCAAHTAALAESGLEAQLAACEAALQELAETDAAAGGAGGASAGSSSEAAPLAAGADGPAGSSSCSRGEWGLPAHQLEELMAATRLFQVQQPSWFDSPSGDSSEQPPAQQAAATAADATDQAQLQRLPQLLRPLRDVVALREIQLQQDAPGAVWPREAFAELAEDALESVVAERRAERRTHAAMQQAFGALGIQGAAQAPAAGSSAAAAGNAPGACSDEDDKVEDADDSLSGLGFSADALDALQAGVEDFLVQQLAAANELALHGGRQEVGVNDLRAALTSSGYASCLPPQRPPAAAPAAEQQRSRPIPTMAAAAAQRRLLGGQAGMGLQQMGGGGAGGGGQFNYGRRSSSGDGLEGQDQEMERMLASLGM